MSLIQRIIAFLGRFCLSLIFISSGIEQILDWQGTVHLLSTTLTELNAVAVGIDWLQLFIPFALSSTPLLLAIAIFCQVIGGLCILLGIQVRLGAFLIALFLVAVNIVFHHFWLLQGEDREFQMIEFMKNLSILGGMLILLAYGKGKKSQHHDATPSSEG